MRFYFDIDECELNDCAEGFPEYIKRCVIGSVSDYVYEDIMDDSKYYSELRTAVDNMIRERADEICNRVVECVSDKISKKRAIVSVTPKASEIAAVNKENIAYFEKMIDAAIAKRFGGKV